MKRDEYRIYEAAATLTLGFIECGMDKTLAAEKAADVLKSEVLNRDDLINYLISLFKLKNDGV